MSISLSAGVFSRVGGRRGVCASCGLFSTHTLDRLTHSHPARLTCHSFLSYFPISCRKTVAEARRAQPPPGAAGRSSDSILVFYFIFLQHGKLRFVDFGFEQRHEKEEEVLVNCFWWKGGEELRLSVSPSSVDLSFSTSFTPTRAAMSSCDRQKLMDELFLL